MIRLNLNISDELKAQIDQAAEANVQTQSELVRKAILLYLAANEGVRRGRTLGLVKPENIDKLETQIVGL
jgi:metal-responsive CopG/Arc/MetJ family transcriptional regulator